MRIANETLRDHGFLAAMYGDKYFPSFLVDKVREILVRLCETIEKQQPAGIEELYVLTHSATQEINQLAEEFESNDSEIETVARELIAEEFVLIASAYGFMADREELIAPRDW